MTHRSKHSQSYKPTEADTPLAHASDESISYEQVPRVLARPLDNLSVARFGHFALGTHFTVCPKIHAAQSWMS
jgi:hypothetical protein